MTTPTTAGQPTVRWQRHYTFFGTAIGLLFVWFSLTPSLLPRGPLFQGLVSGLSGALGYGLGVFGVWLVRFMGSRPASPRPPRWAWRTLLVAGALGQAYMVYRFHLWQQFVRSAMDVPGLRWWDYPIAAVTSLVVLFAAVEVGKLVRRLFRATTRQLNRVAPPRVSAVVVAALLAVLTVELLNGVVVRYAMRTLNGTFAAANDELDAEQAPPSTPLRSGGPGSLVSWESLGQQGRAFVAGGPTVDELAAFAGRPATEPIRAYAGLNSAAGIRATADLAAAELERTGGLDRAVIAVATTTGTGWINEAAASTVEYLFDGDTAIVSMQYSYLPSWLSFLVDRESARQAGQALFEAVDRLVQERPEAQRPRLVVFGESLGSFGGEAPFGSVNNIEARTDGALFTGPTFYNGMWGDLTANRDPGTPQTLPVYGGGEHVRFAARPEDLMRPDGPWESPRVVYLQHPSDPIAWWDTDLVLSRPDWLTEPRGDDVSPAMEWIPFVTFLQVSADMATAVDVPDGHGHRYIADVVDAWVAILSPPGWTPAKTAELRGIVSR